MKIKPALPMPEAVPAKMPKTQRVNTGRGPVPMKSHNPANHVSKMPTVKGKG